MTGKSIALTLAKCRSYGPVVLDILVPDASGQLKTILVAPINCTPEGMVGATIPGASYPDGEILTFAFRVVAVDPPALPERQMYATVVRQ